MNCEKVYETGRETIPAGSFYYWQIGTRIIPKELHIFL